MKLCQSQIGGCMTEFRHGYLDKDGNWISGYSKIGKFAKDGRELNEYGGWTGRLLSRDDFIGKPINYHEPIGNNPIPPPNPFPRM